LEYQGEEALTILGVLHVNKRSFDRFEPPVGIGDEASPPRRL
jgi:hypothetical protein